MSKYFAKGAPWALGVDVTDCKTSYEVMQKAGLDYVVDKCDLMAKMPFGIKRNNSVNEVAGEFSRDGYIFRELPNAYATFRADTVQPLGLVKAKYQVVQNIEAFRFFDNAIGKDKAVWDRAGILNGGAKIYLSAKLPNETKVGNDLVDNYLVFSNSHDGSSSIDIMFTPLRVICTNMLNSALDSSSSYIRIRHTKIAKEKLELGSEILRVACEYAKTSEEFYNSLTKVKLSDEEVIKYLAKLQLTSSEIEAVELHDSKNGYKKLIYKDYLTLERTGISTRKANIIATMFDYYLDGVGQKPIVGTAWGAYNAVTGYYSNVMDMTGEKRVNSLLYGGANTAMQKGLNSIKEYNMAV